MGNTEPKPADDFDDMPALIDKPCDCETCGKPTTKWFYYPKENHIKYCCEECTQKQKEENDRLEALMIASWTREIRGSESNANPSA